MLLGYPSTGNIPISADLDGYIRLHRGIPPGRLASEHTPDPQLRSQAGARDQSPGAEQPDHDRLRDDTLSPLNSLVNIIDPLTGQRRDIYGGLLYAGQNGAPTQQGGTRQPQFSPRVGSGVQPRRQDGAARRLGHLRRAVELLGRGHDPAGRQYGYSSTTELQQSSSGVPITSLSDPFPGTFVQPSGDSLGMLTNVGRQHELSACRTRARRRRSSTQSTSQREFRGGVMLGVGYTGLTGKNLDWQNDDQHQPARSDVPDARGQTRWCSVPNPFYGIPQAGAVRDAPDHRARVNCCGRSRSSATFCWTDATGAHSQYHALILQGRKRTDGVWGATFSYTFSRLNDNQVGAEQLLLERTGRSEQLRARAVVAVLQPGLRVRPQPARLAAQAHRGADGAAAVRSRQEVPVQQRPRRHAARRLVDDRPCTRSRADSRWASARTSPARQFLFGGTTRPEPGRRAVDPRTRQTSPTGFVRNTTDNQYFNLAAFQPSPRISSAMRRARCPACSRRSALVQHVSRQAGESARPRIGVSASRAAQPVQHRPMGGAGELAFGNASFGQIENAGQQHAFDPVHAPGVF